MLDDKSRQNENIDPFANTTEIWTRIGVNEIPPCYSIYTSKMKDYSEYRGTYNEVVQALENGNDAPLYSSNTDSWPYAEQQSLKQLRIKYLRELGELNEAMDLVNQYIEETRTKIIDRYWEFKLMKEKVYILLACGMAARSIPFIFEMTNTAEKCKNAYQLTQCFVLLATVLVTLGKYDAALQVIDGNMYTVFQFNDRALERSFIETYVEARKNAWPSSNGATLDALMVLRDSYQSI